MKIFITGASGFVGKNVVAYFKDRHKFFVYDKIQPISITQDVVIHLAGKAHDLKNANSSEEYYQTNTELTKIVFDKFLASKAKIFITLSSVKAVSDKLNFELTEDFIPNPITHYGKSKLLAEEYILSKSIPMGKRVYILRPCMIHGPCNKGNLNLLYNYVASGLPWILGEFDNSRSYLSIENLCFIIKELIERENIPSGVYNVADDDPLSTNEVIKLIIDLKGKNTKIINLNQAIIIKFARLGDFLKLPLNSERLSKLTESYVVSNLKIKTALGKPLPVSSRDGLKFTFHTFKKCN
jgi:nucleoside-diphosphate-sugar epimerase